MQARLSASTGVVVASLGDERVQVRCWRFQESHIQNQLQMQRPPSVVVVDRASGVSRPDPVLESYLGTRQPASADQADGTAIVLQSDWVEKVQIEGETPLRLNGAKRAGNESANSWVMLKAQRPWDLQPTVGSRALPKYRAPYQTHGVSNANDGESSPKAVQAAIRGPDLPALLEAIQ